jgi:hypothetical protein
MESSSKLTPDTFRGAVGIAPRFKIDLSSADEIAWARGRNVVRVRTYIFGRMKHGTLVSLRTMSTET